MKRFGLLLFLAGCAGSSSAPPIVETTAEPDARPRRIVPQEIPRAKNFVFSARPSSSEPPSLQLIELPRFHAAAAVWGSTGRDHRGRIYYGVSTDGDELLSAHLVEYDPETGRATDRGGAVENLKRLGLARPNENQNKIHSKIWQAADGYLHFASMDEGGENEDGSKAPTFGSHLWRMKPGEDEWEHLAEVREAVIASAVGGKYVYYLGYFGHVLHQWDTERGRFAGTVRVGSVGGHTTRNILADPRGHVFVPSVTAAKVELVEFDESLREVAVFPIAGYGTAPDSSSHGIVGFAPLKDDGFAFVTDKGRLYRLTPRATGSALVELGNIHPDGECYCASLFSTDGETAVMGIGRRPGPGEPKYEWLTFDLRTRRSMAKPLVIPAEGRDVLVYGSATRDDEGRFYLGGRALVGNLGKALAWKVVP